MSCGAAQTALQNALDAGEALHRLEPLIKHGEWRSYIQNQCGFGPRGLRTAQVYMQVLSIAQKIEAKAQNSAHLSVLGALKLISKSKSSTNGATHDPTEAAQTTAPLLIPAWAEATDEQRKGFAASWLKTMSPADGLSLWLGAMPPEWRPELESRLDRQRTAVAKDETLGRLFRQVLNHQAAKGRDAKDREINVAAALNSMLAKMKICSIDLDDVDIAVVPAGERRLRLVSSQS